MGLTANAIKGPVQVTEMGQGLAGAGTSQQGAMGGCHGGRVYHS